MLLIIWEHVSYAVKNFFFLKQTTKQHVQNKAILLKTILYMWWDELAKTTLYCPHHLGGLESK